MPEPLPFPSQAPPKSPAPSFSPLGIFPLKRKMLDALTGQATDQQWETNQNTILENATPFPSISGPNALKVFPIIANLLSNTGAGAALATNDLLSGVGNTLTWPFRDTGPEQWNPGQPQAQGFNQVLPGTDFIPQGQQAGIDLSNLPTLDTTQTFQGTPPPRAPGGGSLPEYKPDFSKADARLEAGKPQPHQLKGSPWESFFTGAGKASGQIDPRTPWATALAQILSGGTAERQNRFQQQEELDLRNEADNRRYQLALAGVDEQRATMEAQAQYQRAVQAESMKQQAFGNTLRMWEMQQPNIQANADGSLIATTRGPDGKITVQRLGFDDALKMDLQIAQAKALFGKEGQISAEMAAAQRLGPLGVFSYLANQADQSGLTGMILDPTSAQALETKMSNFQQELGVSGLPPALITAKVQAERRSNLVQLILNDPNARKRLMEMMLWSQSRQPTQQTNPFQGGKPPAQSGDMFYNPELK